MTPTDASRARPETSQQTVFPDRQNKVLAAGRIKAAALPQHRADQILIKSHSADRSKTWETHNPSDQGAGLCGRREILPRDTFVQGTTFLTNINHGTRF
jgi:hypothetical protein